MKLNIEKLKKGGSLSKSYVSEAHKKPGGSNVGKKTFVDGSKRTGPYVGPSGGAPKGSYPIPDVAHGRSALKLAHNAPNPSGIKAAVYRKYPQLKPVSKKQGGTFKYLKRENNVEDKEGGDDTSQDTNAMVAGKSGIHINPENKGKFTRTKKTTGKSTEQLTHSKNPLTRKRAVFAQNAKKWKHREGGNINYLEIFK